MEYFWGNNRRFNAYSDYFKKYYGKRVQKVAIDAGFTCPNRDGKISLGGCTFCNSEAFNPSYCKPEKSVHQQIDEGIEFHQNRYRTASNYLAYFQAYSNTYHQLENLENVYREALNHKNVIGIVIGTRPDCVDNEKLKFLSDLSKHHYVIVEYGIESCYNKTLARVNRGHTFEQSVETLIKTHEFGIKTGVHVIIGLPGETRDEILNESKILSELPIDNIKFHQLQILKNTTMEIEYLNHPESFNFFTLDEYIDFIIQFIEYLNPSFVIERFAGEVPPRFNAGPNFGLIRNEKILMLIEKKMEEKNTWQGKFYQNK